MESTEFIERARKAFKTGCPKLTDDEAKVVAILLWDDGKVSGDLDIATPEDLAEEEMSYWDSDE